MKHGSDIVFLGGLFPKEKEAEIIQNSIGYIDSAANKVQWSIVEGLKKNNADVKIINSLYVGSYPRHYKKMLIKTYEFHHDTNTHNINAGFLNIFALKQYLRYLSLKKHLKRWAADGKKNKIIIAYALTSCFVRSLKYIKKINPDVNTVMIIMDLPQYMNLSQKQSLIYKTLKKIDMSFINKNLKHNDNGVLCKKDMNEVLNASKFMVLEGIAPSTTHHQSKFDSNNEDKIILYTGTLNYQFGIKNLLQAFSEIPNDDYKLWICGFGEAANEITELCKSDERITFFGHVSTEKVYELQSEATVMINPRTNEGEYTKYSFPSKTMEYLVSGKPVIMYKLSGIPDEYDEYLHYVEDDSTQALRDKIIEVCSKSAEELYELGQCAREWVLQEKNNAVQAKKILDMI